MLIKFRDLKNFESQIHVIVMNKIYFKYRSRQPNKNLKRNKDKKFLFFVYKKW